VLGRPRFRSRDNIAADTLGGCGLDSSDLAQTNIRLL